VPLDEALEEALNRLSAVIEEARAQVTADPLPVVHGDPTLLTQVFQNLVGNAVKFRGETPPRVHIGVQRDDEFWQFTCVDNGIGIAPEYAEKIFVIFQRLHPREDYGGTGIGLALVKKIVEFHGGRIWLAPTPPSGTTLCFTLPVSVAPPSASAAPAVTAREDVLR
jgi:light-regulated signal transduction histidine kinase (bacteriophytochrome)